MAFIKLPGKGVENIGVEVEPFFRVRGVVGSKRDTLAWICFPPDSSQRLQNIPPDAVQQAYGKKARCTGLNRQLGHLVGRVAGAGQVCLNLLYGTGRISGRFKQNILCRPCLIAVFVSPPQGGLTYPPAQNPFPRLCGERLRISSGFCLRPYHDCDTGGYRSPDHSCCWGRFFLSPPVPREIRPDRFSL